MESATFLPSELSAAPQALARPRGAALRADVQAGEPSRGFAAELAAAHENGLPRGERLPVGGNGLPLDAAAWPAPQDDVHLAAWLQSVDPGGLPFASLLAPRAANVAATAHLVSDAHSGAGALSSRAELPGGAPVGGSLAASSGAAEALLARAAVTADGAAPSTLGVTLELPTRGDADGDALALTALSARTARTADMLPAAQGAGAATNLVAALDLEAQAQAPRAEALGGLQVVPSALAPALGASAHGMAVGAFAGPRSLGAAPAADAAARGLGAQVRAEAALASATSADVALADAVRAAAAATDGEQAASLARWLGQEQALERAARSAGGVLETAFASSGAASGAAPQPGTASVSAPGVGAAAAGANPAPYGNAAALDVRDAAWNEQLSGRIRWLVDRDTGEARIKLHPAELGSLDVKISVRDEQTFVHLAASSAAARDELEQSLPRLRELLAQQGLTLGGASVSGGRQEHSPRAYSTHASAALEAQNVTGVTDAPVAGLHGARGADRRIDLYA